MRKFVGLSFAVTVLLVSGVVQQVQARWKSEYADAAYHEWFQQQHDGGAGHAATAATPTRFTMLI
jgi:hypothetical protein